METCRDTRYSIKVQGRVQFEVVSFKHVEELPGFFHTVVELISSEGNPNFTEILDQPVTLTFYRGYIPVHLISGTAVELSQGRSNNRHTYYTLVVEPTMAQGKFTRSYH